ncbi:hypothetical protein B0F90DRAFT_1817112 [Multifurca ochricompacta]|uniref:Uncharacterized protein n=1 Tax=Multifurca ochricompacta TaxID=376703 RepID=A0AAD4QNY3_9AGAM|nr:hypothetical protein B0F90DRAFT_1817112 [Multifurca ochricompacta]
MSTSRFRHPLTGRAPSPINDPVVFEATRSVALDAATKAALRRPQDAPTLPPTPTTTPIPSPPRPQTPFTMSDNPTTNLTQAITLTATNQSLEEDIHNRVLLLLEEARARLQTSAPPADDPTLVYRPMTPDFSQLPGKEFIMQTQHEIHELSSDFDSPGPPFRRNHVHSPSFIPHQIADNTGHFAVARWVAFDYHCANPHVYFTMGQLFDDNQTYTPLINVALDNLHDPGAWAEVTRFRYATYHLDEARRNLAHWRRRADQAQQDIHSARHAMSRNDLYYRLFPHLTYAFAPSRAIPPTQAARFAPHPELRAVSQPGANCVQVNSHQGD